jgi:hypothetical protein
LIKGRRALIWPTAPEASASALTRPPRHRRNSHRRVTPPIIRAETHHLAHNLTMELTQLHIVERRKSPRFLVPLDTTLIVGLAFLGEG